MRFETPWAFLLLLAIPVVVYLHVRRSGRGSLRFSSVANAALAGRSLRQRLLGLPLLLRIVALVLLTLALARPQQGKELVRDVTEGIAIEMVVDRSGSMGAEMDFGGERLTRLDTVKRVFGEFVNGNGGDLPGRPDDLIGMVAFARYADTMCPLTLGHGALARFLDAVHLVQQRSEDGTAIGDALALAAARLKTAEEDLARHAKEQADNYKVKSKVIILLTDGQNNAGRRTPQQAAELAKTCGITVHTIGVGGGESVSTIRTPMGNFKVPMGEPVDSSTLQNISQTTGGIFRTADNADSLRAVYKEIDQLEKSRIESVRYVDYRESFVPFALTGLACLAVEIVLACTVLRRIP